MLKTLLPIAAFFIVSPSLAFADDLNSREIRDVLAALGGANHYSPLEGAGSHGSFGMNVGAGLSNQHAAAPTSALHQELLNADAGEAKPLLNLAKLYLIKGTPFPVDFGATLAKVEGVNVTAAGAHVQWTMLEGFQIPSLAVRGSYGELLGLNHSKFSSLGYDVLAGMGFLRFFNVYGGIGGQTNRANLRFEKPASLSLLSQGSNIAEPRSNFLVNKDFFQRNMFAGLSLTVWPALLSVNLEYLTNTADDLQTYAGKINFLF